VNILIIFVIFLIFSFPHFKISNLFHRCKIIKQTKGLEIKLCNKLYKSEINGNHSLSFEEALIQEQ